ncbi:uncharacterized protein LOC127081897 [Lathyrus oleraceus]|uniref:uncharacterized protein LOC127081897 n=1 Tax=Pisum sativum TaxID=3888 RepID=UPI0021D25960|nr:uncharacterized protein LOC127081897 [Pisum sativum]
MTLIAGVGRALKPQKFTPYFFSPYQILQRIGEVAYQITLLPPLANLHNIFHVFLLKRCILNPSHEIQVDDVQVKDNLIVKASPMRIEDQEVKQLCGKDIILVKIAWGGPASGNIT